MTKRGDGDSVRLAVILSHPTQYYSPWFRWVAAHTDLDLRVFYLWDFGVTSQRDPKFGVPVQWDVDLLSGYESEFVPNRSADPGTHHFTGLRNPELTVQLAAWKPDALLMYGYKWASNVGAIAWARRHRVPLLFRGDSHFLGRGVPAWPTRILLRLVYAQFHAVLPVGEANAEYFSALGVPKPRQFFAPHSVNHELFDPKHPAHRDAARRLRAQLSLADSTHVVLFAGKLVPEKQPLQLLEAFLKVADPASALIFVGDGPERKALEHRAASESRTRVIRFLPFANQSEIPARYLLADILALPSAGFYETWGLAVNEAMHLGVPALVSNRVGCQRDLVTDGKTGWVFDPGTPGDLQRCLRQALDAVAGNEQREMLRRAVLSRIARYTYAQTTEGLTAAINAVLGG
jgi:glycosyltransferase involved in cell wall biosynthesis